MTLWLNVETIVSVRCSGCGAEVGSMEDPHETIDISEGCESAPIAATVIRVRPCKPCRDRAITEAIEDERRAAADLKAWRNG